MKPSSDNREIYSVYALNNQVRTTLEKTFFSVWVSGEVSNFVCPVSGHWYFSLKDEKAQVRCAMFRNRNNKLNIRPENGMQVLVKANVSLYEARGEFQLIIEDLEEAGNGALLRAFEKLKSQLKAQGLFDETHKKPLPKLPKCIGIVTSSTGAALRDVLSVLKRRLPLIPIIIYPSQVQGEAASEQLCTAIVTANQRQECDVLILTRGGGSMEDLWCFNDPRLATVIFESHIPIISAVGHEIDFTIADFVADKRAPTPSVAAELASLDRAVLLKYIAQLKQRLCQGMLQSLRQKKEHCQHLHKRLRHPNALIREYTQRIDALSLRLEAAITRRFEKEKQILQIQHNALHTVITQTLTQAKQDYQSIQAHFHSPIPKLRQFMIEIKTLSSRLTQSQLRHLDMQKQRLNNMAELLNTVSPLATLARGYAIVQDPNTNAVIKTADKKMIGSKVRARLANGQLICQVTDVN